MIKNRQKHILKTTDIKAEKGFLYLIDKDNFLVKINKRKRIEREKIAKVENLEREKKYILFVSSNLEGYLTIERAIRLKKGMEQYKSLNFPEVEIS
jgi:hypothetical protein